MFIAYLTSSSSPWRLISPVFKITCTHGTLFLWGVSETMEWLLNWGHGLNVLKSACIVKINWTQGHIQFSYKITINSSHHGSWISTDGWLLLFSIWKGLLLIEENTFLVWDWGKVRDYWSLLFSCWFILFVSVYVFIYLF